MIWNGIMCKAPDSQDVICSSIPSYKRPKIRGDGGIFSRRVPAVIANLGEFSQAFEISESLPASEVET